MTDLQSLLPLSMASKPNDQPSMPLSMASDSEKKLLLVVASEPNDKPSLSLEMASKGENKLPLTVASESTAKLSMPLEMASGSEDKSSLALPVGSESSDLLSESLQETSEPVKKPSFTQLAPEILSMICNILSKSDSDANSTGEEQSPGDLANLRLVNRQCAVVGARHICKTIHVMFTAESFSSMMEVAAHPVFKNYVTTVVYEVALLNDVDFKTYQENVLAEWYDQRGCTLEEDQEDDEFEEIGQVVAVQRWEGYQKMLVKQERIIDNNRDYAHFAKAFSCFPSLKRIEVDLDPSQEGDSRIANGYEGTDAIFAGLLRRDLEGDDERSNRALSSTLLSIPTASGTDTTTCNIDSIKLSAITRSFFSPLLNNPTPQLSLFNHTLRSITLKFISDPTESVMSRTALSKHHDVLGQSLRSFTKLEHIDLALGTCYSSSPYATDDDKAVSELQTLFSNTTWTHLHTFKITYCSTSEAELTSLLNRHASSLRKLKLRSIYLTHSAQDRVDESLAVLQDTRFNLSKVVVKGYWVVDSSIGGGRTVQDMQVNWVRRFCAAVTTKTPVTIAELKAAEGAINVYY